MGELVKLLGHDYEFYTHANGNYWLVAHYKTDKGFSRPCVWFFEWIGEVRYHG